MLDITDRSTEYQTRTKIRATRLATLSLGYREVRDETLRQGKMNSPLANRLEKYLHLSGPKRTTSRWASGSACIRLPRFVCEILFDPTVRLEGRRPPRFVCDKRKNLPRNCSIYVTPC